MSRRRKYARKPDPVTAIQLDLETEGFTYRKWGHEQRCKRGDWLVDNDGDKYTVSEESFAATYEPLPGSPGRYVKTAPVWAEVAEEAGKVRTQEGFTSYEAGDYLVFNREDGSDPYAVARAKFEAMYEPVEEGA